MQNSICQFNGFRAKSSVRQEWSEDRRPIPFQYTLKSCKSVWIPGRMLNPPGLSIMTGLHYDTKRPETERAEGSPPSQRRGYINQVRVLSQLGSSVTETEKTAEKRELIDEIALLLETLFMEPDMALSGWGSVGESNAEGIAAEEMSHPVEALRAMMEGRLDRLQELLNQVRSMERIRTG